MHANVKHKAVGLFRLSIQIAAVILAFTGLSALVRTMGLPFWALLVSIALAGTFLSGWVCPLGTVQEWLRYIGKSATGITLRIPDRINRYLLLSRYVLFPATVLVGVAALDARRTLMMSITGRTAETVAYVVLGAFLFLALFVERPFCKYVCGFGALAGLVSMLRVFGIKRDRHKCVGCGKCEEVCLMGVEVSKAHNVRDPHCINCGKCVAACPVPEALKPGLTLLCKEDALALKNKYAAAKGSDGREAGTRDAA